MTPAHAEYTKLARALRADALARAQARALRALEHETYTERDAIVVATLATMAMIGRNGMETLS